MMDSCQEMLSESSKMRKRAFDRCYHVTNSSIIKQAASSILYLSQESVSSSVSRAAAPAASQVSSVCPRSGWRRRRSCLLLNPPQPRGVTTGRGLTVTAALFLAFRLTVCTTCKANTVFPLKPLRKHTHVLINTEIMKLHVSSKLKRRELQAWVSKLMSTTSRTSPTLIFIILISFSSMWPCFVKLQHRIVHYKSLWCSASVDDVIHTGTQTYCSFMRLCNKTVPKWEKRRLQHTLCTWASRTLGLHWSVQYEALSIEPVCSDHTCITAYRAGKCSDICSLGLIKTCSGRLSKKKMVSC